MNRVYDYIDFAVKGSKKPIILEIGAAKCEDSPRILDQIFAVNPAPDAYEYYAFEPDPRNIEQIKASWINSRIHLIPAAVGNTCGRRMFNQSSGINPEFGYEHTLSGSLKKPTLHLQAHPWCKFQSQVEVRVVTLDAFQQFFSLPHIDFIWCDVQGAEDLVIEGGATALQKTHFFYTEYHSVPLYDGALDAAMIHQLLGSNWKLVQKWQYDVLFENTSFQA